MKTATALPCGGAAVVYFEDLELFVSAKILRGGQGICQ